MADVSPIEIQRKTYLVVLTELLPTTINGGLVYGSKGKFPTRSAAMIVMLKPLSGKALTVPIPVMWASTIGQISIDPSETSVAMLTKAVGACDVCDW